MNKKKPSKSSKSGKGPVTVHSDPPLKTPLKKMTKKWQKRAKSAFSNALLGEY